MRGIRQDAFTEYIGQYGALVFSICLKFTRNYFDAEDLAQETFLAAYRSLDRFDGRNPSAWLAAIAANKCKDYLKSPSSHTYALSDEDWAAVEDPGPPPEETAVQQDANERAKQLCLRLREPYRRVAVAYFVQGLSLAVLAKQTGDNPKTLETRLYRAKKLLKALWKEENHEQPLRP